MSALVEVRRGLWLRVGVPMTVTEPGTGALVVCPGCQRSKWIVQDDGSVRCRCGVRGRVTA